MARIRTIKPEFWISEQVMECDITARLLFIGIWTFSDDRGVHPKSTKRLKAAVFPGDDISDDAMVSMLAQLEEHGLLRTFSVEGREYVHVIKWESHQRIDKPTFRYPEPPGHEFDRPSSGGRRGVGESSTPERNGKEWKGKDNPSAPSGLGGFLFDGVGLAQGNPDPLEGFEEFWQAYPKRKKKRRGRNECEVFWKKMPLNDKREAMSAVGSYARSSDALCDNARDPIRWLRHKGWRDEVDADPITKEQEAFAEKILAGMYKVLEYESEKAFRAIAFEACRDESLEVLVSEVLDYIEAKNISKPMRPGAFINQYRDRLETMKGDAF